MLREELINNDFILTQSERGSAILYNSKADGGNYDF